MKKLPTFSALLHIGFFMRLVIEILFWRQNGGETTATTTATTTVTATATTTATKRARRWRWRWRWWRKRIERRRRRWNSNAEGRLRPGDVTSNKRIPLAHILDLISIIFTIYNDNNQIIEEIFKNLFWEGRERERELIPQVWRVCEEWSVLHFLLVCYEIGSCRSASRQIRESELARRCARESLTVCLILSDRWKISYFYGSHRIDWWLLNSENI